MSVAARRISSGLLGEIIFCVAGSFAGLAENEVSVHERLQVAIENTINVTDGELGAMVLDHAVRSENVTANLAAKIDVELSGLGLPRFLALLFELKFIKACAELLHGAIAVLVL